MHHPAAENLQPLARLADRLGADVDLASAELRDVELTFPGNDVHYSLPHDYRWKTRDEQPSATKHFAFGVISSILVVGAAYVLWGK